MDRKEGQGLSLARCTATSTQQAEQGVVDSKGSKMSVAVCVLGVTVCVLVCR